MWILDSNQFAKDFINTLNSLKKNIKEKSDEKLIKIINDRLDKLAEEDYKILNDD